METIGENVNVEEGYKYLGLGTVVQRDHPYQMNYRETLIGSTAGDGGDKYIGLDRFGRTVAQSFIRIDSGAVLASYFYGYDRDGNRIWKDDGVVSGRGEVYTYDSLNRLSTWQRGTLNATKTGLTGTALESQSFTADAAGNFGSVTTNGTTQTRQSNALNELTSVGGNALSYDAAGRMTADGQGRQFVWDAWGRLVTVKDSTGATVVSYKYDAKNRRIQEVASNGTVKDLYYAGQPLVEVRVGGVIKEQYIWSGAGGIDQLVLRNRDADGKASNGIYGMEQCCLRCRMPTATWWRPSPTLALPSGTATRPTV